MLIQILTSLISFAMLVIKEMALDALIPAQMEHPLIKPDNVFVEVG